MVRLAVLVIGAAGVFAFLAFQQGGYLPGTILALAAVLLLVFGVASGHRRRTNAGAAAPWSPAAKKVIAAVGVLMAIGVAYSAYWMFWVPKASTAPPKGVWSMRDLCDSVRKYYPNNAAFAGSAPHPIAVFAAIDSVGLDEVNVEYNAPDEWRPTNATDVQLVACLDKAKPGPFLTDCKFTDESVPLYQGQFTGTVFEARTGKEVTTVSVNGVTEPKCPGSTLIKGDNPKIFSAPDLAALRAVLGDKVER